MAEKRIISAFSCRFQEGGILLGQIMSRRETRRGVLPLSLLEVKIPHDDKIQMMIIHKPRGLAEFPNLFSYQNVPFALAFTSQWRMLHNAGLPVPHTIATVSPHEVAMFDITDGGRNGLYGNIEAETIIEAYPDEKPKLGSPQQIQTLLGLNLDYPDNIFEKKVNAVTRLATEKGICLSWMTPLELIVGPHGYWDLCILNCLDAKRSVDNNLALINQNLGKKFISDVQTTFYYLKRIAG
jgi:hypothetical protein